MPLLCERICKRKARKKIKMLETWPKEMKEQYHEHMRGDEVKTDLSAWSSNNHTYIYTSLRLTIITLHH